MEELGRLVATEKDLDIIMAKGVGFLGLCFQDRTKESENVALPNYGNDKR